MPVYGYSCPKCNKIFEEWSHITEDHPKEPCPACGTPSPRIISSTSFVLEGGGWYVTDYGYRKGVKDDSSSKSTADAPVSFGSETKAAGTAAPAAPAPAAPASN